jgi:hypothetical protein
MERKTAIDGTVPVGIKTGSRNSNFRQEGTMRRAALITVAGALLASAVACGGRWMTWRAQPAAPMVAGKVVITVADHREAKKGGEDPSVVGLQRNGWGIPFPVRLPTPTEAADSLRDMLGQAALTAGVGVAPAGDPTGTSHIAVEIQSMWCDGYSPVYKAGMTAGLIVLGPDGAVRVPAVPIQAEDGAWDCHDAYRNMLSKAYQQAVAMMSAPQVRDALVGAGGAPPPPPPPPVQ